MDPDFDLAFHLRRVTAPEPGTVDTVLDMARLAAMADFDRARPLWEVTVIDGLADGGAALRCKLNHALTDGIGAVQIAMTLYDRTEQYRDPGPVAPESRPTPAGPFAGIRDVISYDAGFAAAVPTGSLKAAPALIANGVRRPLESVSTTRSTLASIYRTVRPIGKPGSPIMLEWSMIRRLAVHHVSMKSLHEAGWRGRWVAERCVHRRRRRGRGGHTGSAGLAQGESGGQIDRIDDRHVLDCVLGRRLHRFTP